MYLFKESYYISKNKREWKLIFLRLIRCADCVISSCINFIFTYTGMSYNISAPILVVGANGRCYGSGGGDIRRWRWWRWRR